MAKKKPTRNQATPRQPTGSVTTLRRGLKTVRLELIKSRAEVKRLRAILKETAAAQEAGA